MISSRPLNKDAYLIDSEEISEDFLPPTIKFDCMYYYEMSNKDDSSTFKGEIECIDVTKLEFKTDGKQHVMHIDSGAKKYDFMSTTKYIIQEWMEAIELAKRTADERKHSITGAIKNISRIVTEFEMDADLLAENLKREAKEMFPDNKEWESLDELLGS